jgi:hypothetical protein
MAIDDAFNKNRDNPILEKYLKYKENFRALQVNSFATKPIFKCPREPAAATGREVIGRPLNGRRTS